eukprot:TRINITY_DN1885_c0_g1_i1.p2 TRINITY_DN1885_c0_g1~~TRINITY_DN1885_c0_g1_i1.p2  ORF type:complete len:99 (+),score=18.38 TRINITY_DN1885_c0_g1_i1:130-426(+)
MWVKTAIENVRMRAGKPFIPSLALPDGQHKPFRGNIPDVRRKAMKKPKQERSTPTIKPQETVRGDISSDSENDAKPIREPPKDNAIASKIDPQLRIQK